MTENPFATAPDDTILTAAEVHSFFRCGRTSGYQLTQRLTPLACAPGRWRLGDLRALQAARASAAIAALLAAGDPLADLTPTSPEPVLAVVPAAQRPARRARTVPLAV